MKLKTSFFNPTVLKKDITRFAPLWGIYFIGGLMVMLTVTGNSYDRADYWAASVAAQSIGTLCVVNLVYACLAACLHGTRNILAYGVGYGRHAQIGKVLDG